MYDELIERIHKRIALTTAGSPLQDDLEEAADAIKDLSRLIDAQLDIIKQYQEYLSKTGWIPVTERLPEFEGAVLCMRKSNVYGVRPYQEILYVDEFGFKNFDDIYLADGVVTHWMPLPQPPKEE